MRELTLPARLILLPGLGVGPDIFAPQRKAFGDKLETPDFIPFQGNESIGQYAQRWAEQLNRPGDDRPIFLGGLSFGGMVALEMAAHLQPRPRAVFLIASTREAEQVSLTLQLAQKAGGFMPAGSVGSLRKAMALGWALRDGLDDDGKALFVKCASDIDPAFLKWGAREAVDWPGFTPPADYPPIHQIHGQDDWVLTPPSAPQAALIEEGRHLIHLTHAHTVNRFLFDHILAACPEARVDAPAIEDPRITARRRLALEGAPAGTPLV